MIKAKLFTIVSINVHTRDVNKAFSAYQFACSIRI